MVDQDQTFAKAEHGKGVSLKWCSVSLSDIFSHGKRLEASVYDIEAKQALQLIKSSKYPLTKIGGEDGLTTSYTCARFKRIWVEKSDIPIFQPSSIEDVKPDPDGYLSHLTDTDIEGLRVKKGQVLMTCSGTIGKVTYVSKTLEHKVFSHDLLRIDCKDTMDQGYIYTYLKSKIGNKILLANRYGAVITHIEPQHLAEVPIPNAPLQLKKKIHDLIVHSYDLRDQSNELIDKAERLLRDELKLPDIHELEMETESPVNTFNVKLSKLRGRVDASYHMPVVDAIVAHMKKYAAEITTMSDPRISKNIILAGVFKRTYVQEKYGYPFIGGKEITRLIPQTDKFLSKPIHKARYEKELKVLENTILVTDRGTIGTAALVPKHWDGYAVSQNVLKLIPSSDAIAGYIYIYLNSDYGRTLVCRQTYGSVVDMIDDKSLASVEIPVLKSKEMQSEINDLALQANRKRYQAYQLEEQALKIMDEEVIYAK
ncbi:MAG: restriction endonuclease subunit S [Lachnospiraceae bacterium]|nr:restriction endonuclease subunit S [Lachnospiraceae bacterium]